jgi:beta-fructofuranosidase
VLQLADHWVWDCWLFDDGDNFHIFFLRASKALGDPDRRHFRASVGHAISKDLKSWTLFPDALVSGDAPAWDDVATWTGSVVKNPVDGLFYIFYTGVTRSGSGIVQQVGYATSTDLITWNKNVSNPVVSADSRFYEGQETGDPDTNWRDPWVFFDDRDNKWHMLVTADIKGGGIKTRATVAHATSLDLKVWEVLPPLHGESGFGQVEVVQVEKIDGRYVLIFCVASHHINDFKPGFQTGTYSVPIDSPTGPIHFDRAEIIDADGIYAGRIIKDRDGQWVLLGFENGQVKEEFTGRISDPIPLIMTEAGTLKVKKS